MKRFDSGREQDKLLNRIERKERRESFQRDRFFKYKLTEIHKNLSQALLSEKVVETDNPSVMSELLLRGLKQALRVNEFEFKYFIAPIRSLLPNPNPVSLYITQYLLEVVTKDPSVTEVYGTDLDIYKVVNQVITRINLRFERTEQDITEQLARNKSLVPGSRDYDIALDQLFRKKMGEAQQ
jgi:hypothetical protein